MSEGQRTKNPFRWDHNHGTDEFRGFLCDSCNTSLGKFRDDPDLLARAIKYLGGGMFNSAQRTSCLSTQMTDLSSRKNNM